MTAVLACFGHAVGTAPLIAKASFVVESGAGSDERRDGAALDPRRRLRGAAICAAALGLSTGMGSGTLIAGVLTAAVALPVLYATTPWYARRNANLRLPPSEVVTREAEGPRTSIREAIGFFVMLCIRGCALWVLWPLAFVVWLVHAPVGSVRSRPMKLRQVAGWFDANLIALLESTILRPFFPHPTRFVSWSRAAETEHGPSPLDSW